MIHKESHTYILDLIKDQYFGELGFFTDNPRTLSAKSRDFTETYVINKTSFLKIAEDYIDAIVS
jgi:CRP-like cAMP-binding protein